ncbi:MAG: nucleotidyltransferase family protein [Eubacteriales bacterium]|nr:nucleotidyltransferase family protein [Eubacteriales bacterium]
MKTAAIICEFNPFHNGHAYICDVLRRDHGADHIIAIMSGNYVQRGEPAIFDKYTRARMALTGGGHGCSSVRVFGASAANEVGGGYADLVLEIPVEYATASAHEFAAAGVRIALATGVVNMLCFGVEGGVSLDGLKTYAARLNEIESDPDNDKLKSLLKSGKTYPEAVSELISAPPSYSSPNNILAVEYLRALMKYDTEHRIEAVGICRKGDGYGETVARDEHFCSAAALRNIIAGGHSADQTCSKCKNSVRIDKETAKAGIGRKIENYVKAELLELYSASVPVVPDDLSGLLNKSLLEAKYRGLDLTEFTDVSREIADRLIKRADIPMSFTERVADTKTRQYTYTRVQRALLHICIGIRKNMDPDPVQTNDLYLRILGFRRDSGELMKALKFCAEVPIISKTADHKDLLKDEIYYDQLYYSLTHGPSEYERSPVII